MKDDRLTTQKNDIKSPDDLNRYLRVTNPSMWFVLAAVLIMLIGLILGSSFTEIKSTVYVSAVAKNGVVTLKPSDEINYEEGMEVVLFDADVNSESDAEYKKTVDFLNYNEDTGEYSAEIETANDVPDGKYAGRINLSHTPIEYLFK